MTPETPAQEARATMDVIWRGLVVAVVLAFVAGRCL